ncbi:MAG: glycosyltransferase family 39 protein [Verrucomicrobiota bacterium]|nr:glycosyltransferase family 39 protein [Verrucomicrobiota bacterium]
MQNKTVAYYPTNCNRQLFMPPLAEYGILHLYLLTGSDLFSGLIQFFSFITCIIGSVHIYNLLPNSKKELSFVVAAITSFIPAAILQASTTQTDLIAASWLVIFVYFTILSFQEDDKYIYFYQGLALGLGYLTKQNVIIYAIPFISWQLLVICRKKKYKLILFLLLVGIIAVSINVPQWVRNKSEFGSIHGSRTAANRNSCFKPQALSSNFIRGISSHLGARPHYINKLTEKTIKFIHKYILHFDVHDKRTTKSETWEAVDLSMHEDIAGNPLHLMLFASAVLIIFLKPRLRKKYLPYVLSIIVAYALFCFLLKWSPFRHRLHLPIFVLMSPVITLAFTGLNKKLLKSIVILLFCYSLPYILLARRAPYLPLWSDRSSVFQMSRDSLRFIHRPELFDVYLNAVKVIESENIKKMGLRIGGNSWEYPIHSLLHERNKTIQIQHVTPDNSVQEWAEAIFYIDVQISNNDERKYINLGKGCFLWIKKIKNNENS